MGFAPIFFGSVSAPVTADGTTVQGPLVIGDDYLDANGRAFHFDVDPPTGFTTAQCTCHFGARSIRGDKFLVTGTITEVVDSVGNPKWRLSHDLPRIKTAGFRPAKFHWTAEVRGIASGERLTYLYGSFDMIESQTD